MATKYISYYPNTLEGQALLDNFVRTRRILRYRDNDRIVEHIKRGMPLYEVESLEKRGANEKHNLMMHGECLSTCAYLKEQGIECARRTVAKYREALKIAPANLRKAL